MQNKHASIHNNFFFYKHENHKKRIPQIKFKQLKDRHVANQAELDKHL